jgi:hypothetical protein
MVPPAVQGSQWPPSATLSGSQRGGDARGWLDDEEPGAKMREGGRRIEFAFVSKPFFSKIMKPSPARSRGKGVPKVNNKKQSQKLLYSFWILIIIQRTKSEGDRTLCLLIINTVFQSSAF